LAWTVSIRASDRNARLDEAFLFGTGMLDGLKALPGAELVAYTIAFALLSNEI
jgi:hypothetical protein